MKKFEEDLSRKIKDKVFGWEADLTTCIYYRQLSEDFIRKHIDDFSRDNWHDISVCQLHFSESFLREMREYIIWKSFDNTIDMSVEFIREFAKELDLKHRVLRNEIKNEFNNVK